MLRPVATMLFRLFLLVSWVVSAAAFVVQPLRSRTASSAGRRPSQLMPPEASRSEATRLQAFDDFWTGGAFDDVDEEAAKIASKIRSVQDLGWSKPAKRRGSARPRHRAFGGSEEKAVQDKPNYDESNPLCVEKWLSQVSSLMALDVM